MLHAPTPFRGLLTAPCAIVALSAILGRDWRQLAQECRDAGTLMGNGGMWADDVMAVLHRHGFITETVHGFRGKALKTWLYLPRPADDIYLVGSTRHLAVVQGEMSVGIVTSWSVEPWRGARDVKRRITGIHRVQPPSKGTPQ